MAIRFSKLLLDIFAVTVVGVFCLLLFYVALSISFAIPGSIIFASLEMPKIAKAYSYLPAAMTVREARLESAYCCRLICFCVEVADPKAENCRSMLNRTMALTPSHCAESAPGNSSSSALCPPVGTAAVCNDGHFCCSSCNEACTLSEPQSGCTCPCPQCSACSCCKQIEGRLCRLFCDTCEKLHLLLDFKDGHGRAQLQSLDLNYTGKTLAEGRSLYMKHPANSTFLGFYKRSDAANIRFSRSYSARDWVYFVLMGASPLFQFSVLVTGFLFAWRLEKRGVQRNKVWIKAGTLTWVLWLGIICPFFIFLPILFSGRATPHAKVALKACITLFICLGWLALPLALL